MPVIRSDLSISATKLIDSSKTGNKPRGTSNQSGQESSLYAHWIARDLLYLHHPLETACLHYQLALKHLQKNVILLSFCIPKVVNSATKTLKIC